MHSPCPKSHEIPHLLFPAKKEESKLSIVLPSYIHSAASPIITNTATAATTPTNTASSFPPLDNHIQSTSPLSSFYAQGPTHQIGFLSLVTPSTSFASSPNPVQEISTRVGTGTTTNCKEKANGTTPGHGVDNFVYISNPIYNNDVGCSMPDTTFERSDTSPSHLENNGSKAELSMTSPLSPMKKLPAQVCPVSLRDARSLVTLGSDSNSNNGLSSFSSGSPCSSPSW
ncbi:hypothetical protein Gotri_009219 [Gossypium trilobum]|uniref:Uncharacterized protein n=1 Tax=Gossypium trilobum TaxID=34281 RepID=A0A7J9EN94_9ROSI|nr:hypothetical protein [Gossypium trilobum]